MGLDPSPFRATREPHDSPVSHSRDVSQTYRSNATENPAKPESHQIRCDSLLVRRPATRRAPNLERKGSHRHALHDNNSRPRFFRAIRYLLTIQNNDPLLQDDVISTTFPDICLRPQLLAASTISTSTGLARNTRSGRGTPDILASACPLKLT